MLKILIKKVVAYRLNTIELKDIVSGVYQL